ncbi:hypothetical protein AB0K09_28040 [Streptomyces sp. NPDC049577]|uniref:hypothetical protein n=1 Tax=Streptomyces sp. NPDC049577 TaxID=3155153 RepID=UPI00343F1B48
MVAAFSEAFTPKPLADEPGEALPELSGLADLDDDEVERCRKEAPERLMLGDTSLITVAVDSMGREAAEQLYEPELVRRALQLASGARSSLMTVGSR